MAQTKTYRNGLRLLVETKKEMKGMEIGIYSRLGSAYEKEGEYGLACFITEMLLRGTNKYTAEEIRDKSEELGLFFGHSVSSTYVAFIMDYLKENQDQAIDLFNNVYFDSKFKDEEIEKEKKYIISNIDANDDLVSNAAALFFSKEIWQGTGFSHNVQGEKEDVIKFTKQQIIEFKQKMDKPENIIICFNGNISLKEAEEIYNTKFAQYFSDKIATPFKQNNEYLSLNFTNDLKVYNKKQEQTYLYLAFNYQNVFTKHKTELQVLNNLLKPLIFNKIREEFGLVYYVSNSYYLNYEGGIFAFFMNLEENNVQKALTELKSLIVNYYNLGFSLKDLEDAKFKTMSQVIYDYDNTQNQIIKKVKQMFLDTKDQNFKDLITRLKKIKLSQINSIFKEIINGQQKLVAYGITKNLENLQSFCKIKGELNNAK